MQGCLTKLRILFHCLLDGGQFILSQSCYPIFILCERNGWSLLGAALITKTGRPPVDSGHIAQKNRPIFKDGFLRNVIVSIYFLVSSSKTLRFRVPNKS